MANREIEARLKLSAVDKTGAAFKSLSGRLAMVDRQAKSFTRAQALMARSTAASYAAIGRIAAPAAIAYGLANATKRFASVEDRIARIGITADATVEKTKGVLTGVNQIAADMAMPVDKVVDALETLVASGQSLDEAMTFLPAVVKSAQAAAAETADLATTADAVGRSLGIAGDKAQLAFDIMAQGGKAGKFELKDMAQYLPSIIPAFAAMGYRGEEALGKLVAMLQTVRNYTGDSSEAATSLMNVFQKMESEETVNKFKKFGVDLRAELAQAKKEGRDLIDTFIELSLKATGGDLSKLPQLFSDAQFLAGMRALISGRDATAEMAANLKQAAGTVDRDFNRVIDLSQQKLTKLANSWDKFSQAAGAVVADYAVPVLDAANEGMDQAQFVNRALDKRGMSFWEKRAWWLKNGFDTEEQGRTAFSEGWRSPAGRLAAQGPMSASPELPSRRQDPTAGPIVRDKRGMPINGPDVGFRPEKMSVAEQYQLYGRGRAAAERADAYGARVYDTAASARVMGGDASVEDKREFRARRGAAIGQAMGEDPAQIASRLDEALASGGDKAGQSIEGAARKVNEAGEQAGSTFATMVSGVGKQIGMDAAQAFNANARVPSAPSVSRDLGNGSSDAGRRPGGPI